MAKTPLRRTERGSYCGDCTFHHSPADCPQRWQRWVTRNVGRRFDDKANERLRVWVDQQIEGIQRSSLNEASRGAVAAFEQVKKRLGGDDGG